jgi:hypothetical protein
LNLFIGNGKAKGSKRRNASVDGGPFFKVVSMRTDSLIIQSAMIEVGWILAVGYGDVNKKGAWAPTLEPDCRARLGGYADNLGGDSARSES